MSLVWRLVFLLFCSSGLRQTPPRFSRICWASSDSVRGFSPPIGPNTVSMASLRYTSAELWQAVNARASNSSSGSPMGSLRSRSTQPARSTRLRSCLERVSGMPSERRSKPYMNMYGLVRRRVSLGSWLRVQTVRNSLTSARAWRGCVFASRSMYGNALVSSSALRCSSHRVMSSLGRRSSRTAVSHWGPGRVLSMSMISMGLGWFGFCCRIRIIIMSSSQGLKK